MLRIGLGTLVGLVLAAPLPALAQVPVISYYSGPPVVVNPVSYYTPAPVVTTYYRTPVSYYQPAPVVTYYQQPAPVVSYYSAPAPVVSYYSAPAPIVYPAPVGVTTYRYGLFGRRSATVVNYGW
jgi:hypothetical protein